MIFKAIKRNRPIILLIMWVVQQRQTLSPFSWLCTFLFHLLCMKIVLRNCEKARSVSVLLAPPSPFHPNATTSLHKCIITVSLCLRYPLSLHLQGLRYCVWGLRGPIISLSHYEQGQRENNTHNRSYIEHYLSPCSHPACLPVYLSGGLQICVRTPCCSSSWEQKEFFFCQDAYRLRVTNSPQN